MADVFISHAHEDASLAGALWVYLSELFERPVPSVYVSSVGSQKRLGEDWLQRLNQELHGASVVLVLLTPASIQKPWVNFEAGAAWLAGKRLVPICAYGLTPEELPHPYSQLEALVLKEEKDARFLATQVQEILGGSTRIRQGPGLLGPMNLKMALALGRSREAQRPPGKADA